MPDVKDFDIQQPATEVEIAEAVRWAGVRESRTVRRMAYQLDRLKEQSAAVEMSLASAIEGLLDNWDDWDGEAQQASQQEQDSDVWRFVMRQNIREYLWRSLGWNKRDDN